ncbi:MAG: hypothetical protein K8S94_09385 [Planctomycetia bacterium]|nr:hypothetical protein [Planctomycetia bacterium]
MANHQRPFGQGVAPGSVGNRGTTWLAYILPGLELNSTYDKLQFRNNSGIGLNGGILGGGHRRMVTHAAPAGSVIFRQRAARSKQR